MNSQEQNLIIDVRLSIQRALLGEIASELRVVAFSIKNKVLEFRYYFDGEISEENLESVSCIETEVLADFDDNLDLTSLCLRRDAPESIDDGGVWVYQRREQVKL